MTEIFDEEQTLKNRIILREATIRKLTSKYLDLISKFNTLTRNEMAQLIKEILNEIDMIEISILKAENLERVKEIDSQYQKSLWSDINNKVSFEKNEIHEYSRSLIEARNEKEYKIQCEEIAKIINSFGSKEDLQDKICTLEEDIEKIKNTDNQIMQKLDGQTKKLSLLVKLVDELKNNFSEDDAENFKHDKMLID
jgi:hypothetical protein